MHPKLNFKQTFDDNLFIFHFVLQNIDFRFQFEVEYIAASLLIIVGYLFQSISWSLILKKNSNQKL